MKEIYLLSGLGADERVFDCLDLSAYKVNYIRWIRPLKNESINSYAKRLCDQILESNPILIGVSFGGMMAIEIAKHIEVSKIIQTSSAKTRSDIPLMYRLVGSVRLHRLMPTVLLKNTNPLVYWFFGATRKEDKVLLKAIMHDTDGTFLRWAIHQIVTWRNETKLSDVIQIHGSNDRLLPNRHAEFVIPGGGHLMIVNRAKEIDEVIHRLLP